MTKLKSYLLIILIMLSSACVYQANVAQGNFIEDKYLDQIEVGMTKNQVRFLMGTPMIDDPFHENRWDYVYYLTIGRDKALVKKWVSVLFQDNKVSKIDKNLDLNPNL
ncbi:outer membrane protein assembly factor BamE [Woeseiaceae bacterium]|nr:outer membrane protein assembly factor BamE [Woeseiaceae bacterium]